MRVLWLAEGWSGFLYWIAEDPAIALRSHGLSKTHAGSPSRARQAGAAARQLQGLVVAPHHRRAPIDLSRDRLRRHADDRDRAMPVSLLTISVCDGRQCNAEQAPDFAALNPGYACY